MSASGWVASVAMAVALICTACGGDGAQHSADAPASSTTTAPTTLPPPAAAASELCRGAVGSADPAVVASGELTEISGVAASRTHEGAMWVHNDSGGEPQVHLMGPDGADLGTWPLPGARALDWEDMDIGPGPDGTDHLYVGEIGDNFTIRNRIFVYRAAEPIDVATPAPLAAAEFVFTYPDGAHDAEALLVDPIGGQIHIITKLADGSNPSLYRAPASAEPGAAIELERLGELDVGERVPTAAAVSADGRLIAVRTYTDVLLWDRDPAEGVFEAMSRPPCVAPSVDERQGEAISVLPGGDGYLTISEGENPAINRFELPS